ncbi:MAG: aspartate/glutamate racemase family protein [Sedimentisphaerales bacterium]|nr:aspartate/glutamate racemase family protein [Sedimentisphaerales bacterium]
MTDRHKRITLIHTSPVMIGLFSDIYSEILKGVEVINTVDESLLKDIIQNDQAPKSALRRVVMHILNAHQAGTDLIMVTCSSLGPAAQIGGQLLDIPVIRVDEPMVAMAVAKGQRIGILATLPSTMGPTKDLVLAKARAISRQIEVHVDLCPGAFDALLSGNPEQHDQIVSAAVRKMASKVDVILLAQASMARVLVSIPAGTIDVPILTSPRPAIEHAATILGLKDACQARLDL